VRVGAPVVNPPRDHFDRAGRGEHLGATGLRQRCHLVILPHMNDLHDRMTKRLSQRPLIAELVTWPDVASRALHIAERHPRPRAVRPPNPVRARGPTRRSDHHRDRGMPSMRTPVGPPSHPPPPSARLGSTDPAQADSRTLRTALLGGTREPESDRAALARGGQQFVAKTAEPRAFPRVRAQGG
jgi:hypothetical protein